MALVDNVLLDLFQRREVELLIIRWYYRVDNETHVQSSPQLEASHDLDEAAATRLCLSMIPAALEDVSGDTINFEINLLSITINKLRGRLLSGARASQERLCSVERRLQVWRD